MFEEIELPAGSCSFKIRTGIPFPGQFQAWIKQPYINNFFLSLPYQGVVNVLIGVGDTIKGRIENVIKLFKKPESTGELIENVTKAIRDIANLADEVIYYINIFKNPNMIPTVYVDTELPLGFYIAIALPLPASEYDVAKNALLLDRILYTPGKKDSRMFTKQTTRDDDKSLATNPVIEQAKKTIKQQIEQKIKETISLPEKLKSTTQTVIDIGLLLYTGQLKGLSIYDSVMFYWKNYRDPEHYIDTSRVGSFTDLLVEGFTGVEDVVPIVEDENANAIIRPTKDRLYSNIDLYDYSSYPPTGKIGTDKPTAKFLGVSKNIEYKNLKEYVMSLTHAAFGLVSPASIRSRGIYQWFGMMYVPILPYRDARTSEEMQQYNLEFSNFIHKDYRKFRELHDELLESEITGQNIEEVKRRMKQYISHSEQLSCELTEAGLSLSPDTITRPEDNRPSLDILESEGTSGDNVNADNTELDYRHNEYKIFRPRFMSIDELTNNTEKIAYYAISRRKFIDEIVDNRIEDIDAVGDVKKPVSVEEYGDFLRKIFFPANDNLLEMTSFFKSYYDMQQELLTSGTTNYEIARRLSNEFVDQPTDYYYAEAKLGRMPIVEDIVAEGVYKLFTYHQLINALSGIEVGNTTHYIVSLDPFTEHIPIIPDIVRLDLDDIQKKLYAITAGPERYIKLMNDYNDLLRRRSKDGGSDLYGDRVAAGRKDLPIHSYGIYRDFLPIRTLVLTYEDIASTSIQIFGYNFNVPAHWNSLKPTVTIEVYDFAGRPFGRYLQMYRKLVFRNNGAWPLLHLSFILDIIGIDNTLRVTDLISLLVVPRSMHIGDINYSSETSTYNIDPIRIDFEVIGFVDYVNLSALAGVDAITGHMNVIEHVNFSRLADPNNPLSDWYHAKNFNPGHVKYPLYDPDYSRHVILKNKRKGVTALEDNARNTYTVGLESIRSRTARGAHLIDGEYPPGQGRIKVFEPEIGGRVSDLTFREKT